MKETIKPQRFLHRNLLGIKQLSKDDIVYLLDLADSYIEETRKENQKKGLQRGEEQRRKLQGRVLINLFFEDSTRTQKSFEMAAKRLGCDVMDVNVSGSSIHKGESALDTIMTLGAMQADFLVIRHSQDDILEQLIGRLKCAIINAGDGCNEHPSQALLDALAIRKRLGHIDNLCIAICGDIKHSRVAVSNILLLDKLGCNIHLIAPEAFLPSQSHIPKNVKLFTSLKEGLAGADIVMALRIQKERILAKTPLTDEAYHKEYGLTHTSLGFAKKEALVMHPGPINRGIEISSKLADDPKKSLIAWQVEMGVMMRMAILDALSYNLT